jgi:hypothetical protein
MTDDAIRQQGFYGVELLVARDFWVDAVQLPEVDLLNPKPASAFECLLGELFGPANRHPHIGPGACQSAFGSDEHALVWVQGFKDQLFGDIGPVGIGCIDEIHAEVRQAPQCSERLGTVRRLALDARASDSHRAKAKPIDLDISANFKSTRSGGV